MEITAFSLAMRFVGTKEVSGTASNPMILAMLQLDQPWPEDDSVAWCSAWINYICWLLRLPRSHSLAARSWLSVGLPVSLQQAEPKFDVVILSRGAGVQPGSDVIAAPGHVGFFAGVEGSNILLLGGNQGNAVSVAPFARERLLGVRRLYV